jgi:hypothetical protein
MKNYSNKEVKAQKRKRRKINLDVDQCINAQHVFGRCMSEIESLGLQKLVVVVVVGFLGVLSLSFSLLLIMVLVDLVVVIIQ